MTQTNANKKFAVLKGKGAEIRDLTPAVGWVWSERARGHKDFGAIDRMFKSLVETQDLLHDHKEDLILPIDVAKSIFKNTKGFLLNYQKLAYEAETRGECLWSMPTKFHWLYHWGERARLLNPRKTNTLIDEDFVGYAKDLAHSCAAGTELHMMPVKACDKYRWAMFFLSAMHR